MIKVDQNICIGCGLCASMCPDIFVMNAEGKSEVTNPAGDHEAAREAAAACPVNAIIVEE